jgi:calcineurin-like phosphoesterase family protein
VDHKNGSIIPPSDNVLRGRFWYYIPIILILMGLIWILLYQRMAATSSTNKSEAALAAGTDPVIAAAGDIACDPSNANFKDGEGSRLSCRQKYTSDLLVNAGFAGILVLGDNQYECGGYQAFLQSYDLSWGRVKSITHPVLGNHEHLTSGGTDCASANAAGYFTYFGAAAGEPSKGYYSFDIGAWHLIALNSNCGVAGGCSATSPQGKWLEDDLATHANFCTLAYWHIPLFSSGGRASINTKPFWQILYEHNADLVLSAHDHIYERFAPQTPDGTLDSANGIREFIVGSGGANHTSITAVAANSELSNTDTYGVLKLTLHPASYDWHFIPEAGKSFTDSGKGECH